jgi:hypothetical protein
VAYRPSALFEILHRGILNGELREKCRVFAEMIHIPQSADDIFPILSVFRVFGADGKEPFVQLGFVIHDMPIGRVLLFVLCRGLFCCCCGYGCCCSCGLGGGGSGSICEAGGERWGWRWHW